MRRFAFLGLFVLALACSSRRPAADAGTPEEDAGDEPTCGPPRDVGTGDVGAGFLAPTPATYVRTVDGDTAHFQVQGQERTFRFLYVNTEESSGTQATAFGLETKAFVKQWLDGAAAAGATFMVAPQEGATPGQPNTDPYQRILALVFVDGALVQQRLVREGWSAYYTVFGCAPEPIGKALLLSEMEARDAQRGVWAPGHPTDYAQVLAQWTVGRGACRPNPFVGQPYCP